MTKRFMTKYLKIDNSGNRKYRRRVPGGLQSGLGKKEFVKLLGKTDDEAMKNYGPYHAHIEQLLVSTKSLSDPAELLKGRCFKTIPVKDSLRESKRLHRAA